MNNDNEKVEYKQVFIVNKSLHMSAGKIAAQCCHAEVLYMEDIQYYSTKFEVDEYEEKPDEMLVRYEDWRLENIEPIGLMKKVVLKASEDNLKLIITALDTLNNIKYYKVYDKGYTQVKSGSLTCIAIEPLKDDVCDELFGHLKLL